MRERIVLPGEKCFLPAQVGRKNAGRRYNIHEIDADNDETKVLVSTSLKQRTARRHAMVQDANDEGMASIGGYRQLGFDVETRPGWRKIGAVRLIGADLVVAGTSRGGEERSRLLDGASEEELWTDCVWSDRDGNGR